MHFKLGLFSIEVVNMLMIDNLSSARNLFRTTPVPNSRQDHILGALLGAAIGDVMGQAISGKSKEKISQEYGAWGISSPPHDSIVSHHIQLILFAIDALIFNTQKNQKLSNSEIAQCLISCTQEWELMLANPRNFHGQKEKGTIGTCTEFMKNYPLWRVSRSGLKTLKSDHSAQINPLLLGLSLFARENTIQEVAKELLNEFSMPIISFDINKVSELFTKDQTITKESKIQGLDEMREKINGSSRPDLMGMIAGFEHGATYGVRGFKQIWYLRIDIINLCEQLGWLVGRNIKY
jgi:hypothetical protein